MADSYLLRIAKRGNKDRNKAIRTALENAESEFETRFGVSRGGIDAWEVKITDPQQVICLQAADYFLWALQRFYEPAFTSRLVKSLANHATSMQCGLKSAKSTTCILPMSTGHSSPAPTPLTLEARFGPKVPKRKKPQV